VDQQHHGRAPDGGQLNELRVRAHRLYEANTHIFEDECEALAAVGVVCLADVLRAQLQPAAT
jgi:hypothetical protein